MVSGLCTKRVQAIKQSFEHVFSSEYSTVSWSGLFTNDLLVRDYSKLSTHTRADNGSGSQYDPHDPSFSWPMTQSQTMAWADHDYSRIMMSSRLLPSLLCAIWNSGHGLYAVYIFIT